MNIGRPLKALIANIHAYTGVPSDADDDAREERPRFAPCRRVWRPPSGVDAVAREEVVVRARLALQPAS